MTSKLADYICIKISNLIGRIQRKADYVKLNKMIKRFSSFGSDSVFHYFDYNVINPQYISVGSNVHFGHRVRLELFDEYAGTKFAPILKIGNNVNIGPDAHIGCINKVEIGNGVLFASNVFIMDHFHGNISKEDLLLPPSKRPLSSKPVKIGNNVWLGERVCVLPGVELGDNVIVGAGAIVTKSFPANSIIAGCPAKLIRVLE